MKKNTWKTLVSYITLFIGILAITHPVYSQDVVNVVDQPNVSTQRNDFYPNNRPPLRPNPLTSLPVGNIEPEGWLLKQLELEANGMVGQLGKVSGYLEKQNNAWLSSEGKGENGWEEVPYWLRGFSALGYILEDERIMKETQRWIEPIIASQREDGYFGPRSNLKENGHHDMMPNMFMMFALRSYYEYTKDQRIIDLLTEYFKWQLEIPDDKFFSGGWQAPRNGDNLVSVYWLYKRTGDKFLLDLAEKLQRTGASWMNAPSLEHREHNVTYSQGFRKPGQFYVQSKNPKHLGQAYKNYETIHDIYGQVPGGMFGGDEFARPGFTDPRNAIETCGIVEMMQSQEILLQISGDLRWADRCENVAYNSLPAAMTADMKALRYLTAPNMIASDRSNKAPKIANPGDMFSMDPHDHRCCQHNVSMGWPYFAKNLWQATPDNGLAAVLYAPNTIEARVGDGTTITIEQKTKYPFEGEVELTFSTPGEVNFPLYLRVPEWCEDAKVQINDKALEFDAKPRSYIRINRKWKDGDQLSFHMPMEIQVKHWRKNHNSASVKRGPLTFSVKIDERYERYGGTDKWPAYEIFPESPWNYALALNSGDQESPFEVVKKSWPESQMVFTHEGAPIEIRAKARKVPNWKDIGMGLPGKMQDNPTKTSQPVEEITLIPMGAARLRLTAFPVSGDGKEASAWKPPEPMPASYWPDPDDPEKLHDGRLPVPPGKNAGFFEWVGWAGYNTGKDVWVRHDFDEEKTVGLTEIYWADSTDSGWFVPLENWKIQYLDRGEWKPIEVNGSYEFYADRFTPVSFKPVKTRAMRIFAETPDRKSAGIFEWRVWSQEDDLQKHTLMQNFGVDIMGDPKVRTVESCIVHWFVNEKNPNSDKPEKWKLYYRKDDEDWKPVEGVNNYGLKIGEPNMVKFDPFKATEMKMEVYAEPGISAGPREWEINTK